MKLSGNEVLFCALIFLCICAHAGGGALWPPLSRRCRQTGVTFYISFILATTLTRSPCPVSLPSALLALDLCGSFLALPLSLFPGGGDCHSCCIFLESQAFVLAACRLTWVWVKRVRRRPWGQRATVAAKNRRAPALRPLSHPGCSLGRVPRLGTLQSHTSRRDRPSRVRSAAPAAICPGAFVLRVVIVCFRAHQPCTTLAA